MMYGLFNGYGGYGFGGMFMMLLFWGVVIWLIVYLARGKGHMGGHMCGHDHDGGHGKDKNSLDILKERYAKGEIDKKEFEEKKKDLSS